MHARRSSPAAPDEPYAGMASRILGSRILTSSLCTLALRSGHQRRDMRDELARELDFLTFPQRMLAAVVEQRQRVVVGAERVLREVGGNQRHVLAHALFLCVGVQLLAFGSEA